MFKKICAPARQAWQPPAVRLYSKKIPPGGIKLISSMKRVTWPTFVIFFIFVAGASASGPDIEAFSNLSYPMQEAPGGQVTLKDGSFSRPIIKGSVAEFQAKLLGHVATASWKGRGVAAVVLFHSEGGSGSFRRLFFLTRDEKGWTPRAWTNLGDRVKIKYLGLQNHGKIVVGMIAHGAEDPQCCPTQKVARIYIVRGNKLLPEKTVPVQIFPYQVHFSRDILKGDISAYLVPEQGFSAHGLTRIPPFPSHVALVMNGRGTLRIFPAKAYVKMWLEKNDLTINIATKRIQRIIDKKNRDFTPPLPILPPHPGVNDLAARPALIPIKNGAGIGFIGRIATNFSCVSPENLRFYFSGLANENRYVVSFVHEISVKKAPDGLWSCNMSINGLRKQIGKVSKVLGNMKDDGFQPSIKTIRAFLASISIENK